MHNDSKNTEQLTRPLPPREIANPIGIAAYIPNPTRDHLRKSSARVGHVPFNKTPEKFGKVG